MSTMRSRVIREKGFLYKIYEEWYDLVISEIPTGDGNILEIGSGGGFLKEMKSSFTSDILPLPNLDVVMRGEALPFRNKCLKGIVMTNVLHHIPDVKTFFNEATIAVRPGGVIAMIEPWITPWSLLVYKKFHHEPLDQEVTNWKFCSTGPLSGANEALPWIIFKRDKEMFIDLFPQWDLIEFKPLMPFSYLLSGGVSMRQFLPEIVYPLIRVIEKPLERRYSMFIFITLRRNG